MDVYEMAKTMTREEFLTESQGYCPKSFGIAKFHSTSDECKRFEDCPECREYAIKDIKFKGEETNLSQVQDKQNDFDITKAKHITKEQLSIRGYKTGDILFDGISMCIVYGEKVLHINDNCVETLNPKAFDRILPVELIESDLEIQKLLSSKLSSMVSYCFKSNKLEDYFIKIGEAPKPRTICSVNFTVNSDKPKDFILENNSDLPVKIGDIVECYAGSSYQYAKVIDIKTLELSEYEIKAYKTCRNLSIN